MIVRIWAVLAVLPHVPGIPRGAGWSPARGAGWRAGAGRLSSMARCGGATTRAESCQICKLRGGYKKTWDTWGENHDKSRKEPPKGPPSIHIIKHKDFVRPEWTRKKAPKRGQKPRPQPGDNRELIRERIRNQSLRFYQKQNVTGPDGRLYIPSGNCRDIWGPGGLSGLSRKEICQKLLNETFNEYTYEYMDQKYEKDLEDYRNEIKETGEYRPLLPTQVWPLRKTAYDRNEESSLRTRMKRRRVKHLYRNPRSKHKKQRKDDHTK
mmetsp:Transcript_24383/g.45616  ORF Transcript_24383/g.45616 Transcript_24383/m.45616 type:complete len:266 (-) Transcript_24383:179-976(-)|eukprot:CAMPEP_0170195548 /NCGR_PEP_ID=MMETSP0040_2-20121228/61758_1 /TAXON_ID=641309 /ORGANISM="Lotharella oceanica, Strain CCMP622" /LENGTH=265 /DNA_ID=CAMNT_0010444739 /DNA_START=91 /DNA_END=888 /DNA_ORIENTATION=+